MSGLVRGSAEQRFCELIRRLAPRPIQGESNALASLNQQLRFRADVGYGNPGREVVRVRQQKGKAEVLVNRFVLAGLFGPLPEPYQELAARRDADGDSATRAFLDLFNHRINLLRFWLLARHQPGLSALHPAQTPLARLAVGLATGSTEPGREIPLSVQGVVGLSGLLRHPHRSLTVIQEVLRRVLPHELRVLPFVGGWVRRRAETYSRLGKETSRLGQSAILGTRHWDSGQGIELRLRFQTRAAMEALLPGGEQHPKLCSLLRWLTGGTVAVHVACFAPVSRFGAVLSTEQAPALGYTTRLSGGSPAHRAPVRFVIHAGEGAEPVAGDGRTTSGSDGGNLGPVVQGREGSSP